MWSNTTVIIFCLWIYSHMFWLLKAILGLKIKWMHASVCVCVRARARCIFALNFWSHLQSQTANQGCRMCGDENDNWYMMKTIYTKWKLGGTLYAVNLILTLTITPSCSWPFIQQVWYSNGGQAVIVEFNTNISVSMFGKFPNQRPVFIPGMCTVPCNQSKKCQVH